MQPFNSGILSKIKITPKIIMIQILTSICEDGDLYVTVLLKIHKMWWGCIVLQFGGKYYVPEVLEIIDKLWS